MKYLITVTLALLATFTISAQTKSDTVKIVMPLRLDVSGTNHISIVKYEVLDNKVYALITIQHPVPNASSCGAMCYRTTVRKLLNADATNFRIISEPLAVACDDNKLFIKGMERNENKELTDSYLDIDAGMIYTSKGKIDINMAPLGKLVNELSVTNYELFDADIASLVAIENYADRYQLYLKDKYHVYRAYSITEDADSKTLESAGKE